MDLAESLKWMLIAGVGAGGTLGGAYVAIRAKSIKRIEHQVSPEGTDGRIPDKERPNLHDKLEEIMSSLRDFRQETNDRFREVADRLRTTNERMGELDEREASLSRKVDRGEKDRDEILRRVRHVEVLVKPEGPAT